VYFANTQYNVFEDSMGSFNSLSPLWVRQWHQKPRTTAAAALLCHRQSGHTTHRPHSPSPHPQTVTYDQQPYAALFCRLLVSTPVSNVKHMDYYSFTDPGGKEG